MRAEMTSDEEEASLERLITAAPDSPEVYGVLADSLQAKGDPLGEFIAIQLEQARRQNTKRLRKGEEATLRRLRKEERALLEAHRATWLGADLARREDRGDISCTWRFGFLHSATIGRDQAHALVVEGGEQAYRALRECPAARFLRELHIGDLGWSRGAESHPIVHAIEERALPKCLRVLRLGSEDCYAHLGSVEPLWAQLGESVEELRMHLVNAKLGTVSAPHLRLLELGVRHPTEAFADVVSALTHARWPSLETLRLRFRDVLYPHHDDRYPGRPSRSRMHLDAVGTMLASDGFSALKTLSITDTQAGDRLAEMLSKHEVLRRLRHLDLSSNGLTDEGAAVLFEQIDVFAHLESLSLSRNALTDRAAHLLLDRGVALSRLESIDLSRNAISKVTREQLTRRFPRADLRWQTS